MNSDSKDRPMPASVRKLIRQALSVDKTFKTPHQRAMRSMLNGYARQVHEVRGHAGSRKRRASSQVLDVEGSGVVSSGEGPSTSEAP